MIAKLEMFLALAKEQHFGRAAHSLGITQPTLSTGIRQLEETLGVQLVRRGSRYGGLTPEGQRALERARQIVGDTRRLRDEMRASHAGMSGHLRLAVIPTALTQAARLTSRFVTAHPNVSFTMLSRSSIEILEMIENLDADAGVTYLDNEPLGRMTTQPLYRERYRLVTRRDGPFAGRSHVGWDEVAAVPLCLLTPDMQNRRIINRQFMDAGVSPTPLVEANSTIALVTHVIEGGLCTILPDAMAAFLAAGHDLDLLPLDAGGRAPAVGVVTLHQDPQTPVLSAFLRAAQEAEVPEQ
ncbi:LysR family transcriptional regulator [Mesobacterium pallidum]|uniref:LysR family transcriptional regulator n=1 Tax=Mesobacterium pallidum TaxID=2872037 RepID=UPI001EE2EC02|nr:LysR family transcriptional regulator [Mesobacterium pallidum]